jgi:small nuclear ribonucleoprotein (snRNP)-like protein
LLARLEAKIDNNQERIYVNRKEMREEMKSTVNAFEEKMNTWLANMRDDWKERASCQEKTEARLECE